MLGTQYSNDRMVFSSSLSKSTKILLLAFSSLPPCLSCFMDNRSHRTVLYFSPVEYRLMLLWLFSFRPAPVLEFLSDDDITLAWFFRSISK